METIVFNELKKYVKDKVLRYDVPGHKGNIENEFTDYFGKEIIRSDVNSMKRLDNLNYSSSIIKKTQKNIAKVHGSFDSRILVNGTTLGIQAMIMASVKEGEYILVPKNCHKSVESALFLSGAKAIYVEPDYDEELGIYTSLSLKNVKKAIKNQANIKAALLINPSYYGVCGEIESIVKFLKEEDKIVLIDEAHGAHFYFGENRPKNAMELGADMSSISYHKTLGSLTQTSLLLFNSEKISIEYLDKILTMLTTTSPSYLFITSIEVTVANILKEKIKEFDKKIKELDYYKRKINEIVGFTILDNKYLNIKENQFDKLRMVIKIDDLEISGFELYDILRDKYNIQIELGEENIILFIITIYDNLENLNQLITALKEISNEYKNGKRRVKFKKKIVLKNSRKSLREIFYMEKELCLLKEANSKICGESIMLYPPGISIIKQGEIFTEELIKYIEELKKENQEINGLLDDKVYIVKE